MARADKALYLAKNSGRDCVKIAPRPSVADGDGEGAAISLMKASVCRNTDGKPFPVSCDCSRPSGRWRPAW